MQVARGLAPDGAASRGPSSRQRGADAALRRREDLRDIITVLRAHEQLGFRPREQLLAGEPGLVVRCYPEPWLLGCARVQVVRNPGPLLPRHLILLGRTIVSKKPNIAFLKGFHFYNFRYSIPMEWNLAF